MHRFWQILGIIAFWVSFPLLIPYLNRSERTRIAIMSGQKMVVVKGWLGTGKWGLPGGGLHRGEAPLDGLLREVTEETGIHLAASQVHPIVTEPYRYHGVHFPCHYYVIKVSDLLPLQGQQYEIVDIAWMEQKRLTPKNSNLDVLRMLQLLHET